MTSMDLGNMLRPQARVQLDYLTWTGYSQGVSKSMYAFLKSEQCLDFLRPTHQPKSEHCSDFKNMYVFLYSPYTFQPNKDINTCRATQKGNCGISPQTGIPNLWIQFQIVKHLSTVWGHLRHLRYPVVPEGPQVPVVP